MLNCTYSVIDRLTACACNTQFNAPDQGFRLVCASIRTSKLLQHLHAMIYVNNLKNVSKKLTSSHKMWVCIRTMLYSGSRPALQQHVQQLLLK